MKKAKNCLIIVVAGWNVFVEFANAIKYSLEELGVKTDIIEGHKFRRKNIYDMYIVIKAFRTFIPNMLPPNTIKILYQVEQMWNRRDAGYYDLSKGWDRVFEVYEENVNIKFGTDNVVHVPYGYSPAYETDIESEEIYDVVFYGSMTDSRKMFRDKLKKMGYKTKFLGSFGCKRDKDIMKSKIILNIKAHSKWSYTPLHCLLAQCKKKFLLTEKADSGYNPYTIGRHFMEYNNMENLKRKLDYWLPKKREREQFAEIAYNDIKENHNFTKYLKNGLGEMI